MEVHCWSRKIINTPNNSSDNQSLGFLFCGVWLLGIDISSQMMRNGPHSSPCLRPPPPRVLTHNSAHSSKWFWCYWGSLENGCHAEAESVGSGLQAEGKGRVNHISWAPRAQLLWWWEGLCQKPDGLLIILSTEESSPLINWQVFHWEPSVWGT